MTTVTRELLERFDVPGPRYTSYPTADRFVEAFGARDYELALEQRRSGPAALALPLSIYVHIPFCESLCYYCACNKIITKHHERSAPYLQLLSREVDLHVRHLGRGASVSQLHLGGGTPTFFNDEELAELMAMLRRNFSLVPGGEYSIEVDPRTVDETRLETLARLGFNRLSFGVQDFDPTVQKAVHRVQPAEQVFALVAAARRIGFESVNVDLIYGLPKQTPESFDRTLAHVTELRPDRIALYAYAHLPERFKPQRRIIAIDLPTLLLTDWKEMAGMGTHHFSGRGLFLPQSGAGAGSGACVASRFATPYRAASSASRGGMPATAKRLPSARQSRRHSSSTASAEESKRSSGAASITISPSRLARAAVRSKARQVSAWDCVTSAGSTSKVMVALSWRCWSCCARSASAAACRCPRR